jgi:uncharacterized protein (DUF305 family)
MRAGAIHQRTYDDFEENERMTITKSLRRAAMAVVLIALPSLVLSACSDGDDEAKANNAQDVSFAQNMIPHHAQALEMAKVAEVQASSSEVKALAKQIEAAQQPEIDTMNSWLKAWGEATVDPKTATQHSDHMSMPGMMSSDDMKKLMASHGSDYDRMFLQMMIEHHKGAIDMAKTETAKGKYPDAKAMADSIATSQQAEVTQMERLLAAI